MENDPDNRTLRVLLVLAIPLLFVGLGANSIWDANEAFYVETPRQMVLSGDYVNPTFNATPRFNKPVLSYWIVAGFYRVFGVSVAVERWALALGALGILAGAYAMGRAIRSPATGALSALLLATAPRVLFFSRRIFIDVYLALFMTLALACVAQAERHPQHRRRYLMLMYVALGLGVLTKGPIALAIPGIALSGWLLAERRLADLRRFMVPAGAVIILAIVMPWYAAVYAQHGWEYIRFFFLQENLERYASSFTTERGPAFFLGVLFADVLLPWAPLLAVAAFAWWRQRREETGTPRSIHSLLWWWVATTVAIFSVSASKEDLYILPAIPAAAVLIADLLIRTGAGARHRGVAWMLGAIGTVSIALAGLVSAFFTSGFYRLAGAWALAVILAATGTASLLWLLRGGHARALVALLLGFVLFDYVFIVRTLPDVERLKPAPVLAPAFLERASPDATLATLNVNLPSLVYYTSRHLAAVADAAEGARLLSERDERWLVVSEADWREVHALAPAACLVTRAPLFLSKGSDILRGQPPPSVVLATNKCR
ncbi:MAG TPA: glycosyltransferase family 39 protein [Vicinamibacterales bacterium]|nr:glycosyltransferase family 39 protein [Vicinamibacterales bacterium]